MVRLKTREALHERLRRELANCVKCGTCMAFCPVYRIESSETSNMRGRLALLQSIESGRKIPADAVEAALAKCAGCLTCRSTCPNKVETGLATIIGRALHAGAGVGGFARRWATRLLRRHPVGRNLLSRMESLAAGLPDERKPDASILRMLKSVVHDWRESVKAGRTTEKSESDSCDVLIVPGCRLSLRGKTIQTAVNLVKQAGGQSVRAVDIGCCGLPALMTGDIEGYAESVRRLFTKTARISPKRILFLCPECWYAWRLIPDLCDLTEEARTVWKAGEEFHEAVSRSAWKPPRRINGRFVLHDACLYIRGGGDKQAPGRLLERIVAMKPLSASRDGSCCGSHGGLVHRDPKIAAGIASDRIEELCKLGPDTVVTHCSRCRDTLAAGLRVHGIKTITLLELLGEANAL